MCPTSRTKADWEQISSYFLKLVYLCTVRVKKASALPVLSSSAGCWEASRSQTWCRTRRRCCAQPGSECASHSHPALTLHVTHHRGGGHLMWEEAGEEGRDAWPLFSRITAASQNSPW